MKQRICLILVSLLLSCCFSNAVQAQFWKKKYKKVGTSTATTISDISILPPKKCNITWLSPKADITLNKDANTNYEVRLCLDSESEIEAINLYVNDRKIKTSLAASERDYFVVRCSGRFFKKNITLKEGKNRLKLTVTNDAGVTTSSTRTIHKKSKIKPSTEKRLALVIGNSAYTVKPLKNPVNDADGVSERLESLGFKVMKYKNLGHDDMEDAIDEFKNELVNYTTGLLYYSGHGMQVKGENYLIPVDGTRFKTPTDAKHKCVSLDYILGNMEDINGQGINLVFLDACRSSSFRSWEKGTTNKGLNITSPKGSLVAFATSPHEVASDGVGNYGTYTAAFLNHLKAGDSIYDILTNVKAEVSEETNGEQQPWFNASLNKVFRF